MASTPAIQKIAEFKVKHEKLDECGVAIVEFVDAVRRHEPGTLRYEAYQRPDTVSFVHFMAFRDEAAEQVHRTTPHVKKFVSILYPNCDEEPQFTDLRTVR